jgi:hypothetical protein
LTAEGATAFRAEHAPLKQVVANRQYIVEHR